MQGEGRGEGGRGEGGGRDRWGRRGGSRGARVYHLRISDLGSAVPCVFLFLGLSWGRKSSGRIEVGEICCRLRACCLCRGTGVLGERGGVRERVG